MLVLSGNCLNYPFDPFKREYFLRPSLIACNGPVNILIPATHIEFLERRRDRTINFGDDG